MSKGKILVTDSLFVFDEHVKQLEDAGYEVERLDKTKPSDEELKAALQDKVGYLLGGIEAVGVDVLDAAPNLKAISVAAIGYPIFLPAWRHALDKGIKVTYTPDGPTSEVAEWALMAALMMNRFALKLGRINSNVDFEVTPGIEGKQIGIIGFGRIGSRIATLLKPFEPASINYFNRHQRPDKELELGVAYKELNDLLSESDIVFVCLPDEAQGFIDKDELQAMKSNALLVNITHRGIIDPDALLEVLKQGSIRAISDYPMDDRFSELPLNQWYCMIPQTRLVKQVHRR
jgi:phosphoglycerate dehydrogenase-like enzyme